MALKIIKNYLTKNRCYQQNKKRKPIGIQLHTIGTGQGTAQAVADYWNQSAVSACVTYIVDCDTPGKVLQCLPEDVYSWADGGYGNRNLITFEICESDYIRYNGGANYTVLNGDKFKSDIMRGYHTAVLLCADICRRYGWDPTGRLPSGLYLISSHDEGRRAGLSSAHVDPTHVWNRFGLTMDGFRKAVKAAMDGNTTVDVVTEPDKYYRVRKGWGDAGTQLGAYTVMENAKNACPPGYSVYDWTGKAVYTNGAVADGTQTSELAGLSETAAAARILEICRPIAEKYGLFPSVAAAQTILESGYCTTELAKKGNNVCGMKCMLSGNTWPGSAWDGKSKVNILTAEQDKNGKVYYVYADFRKYPCIEDSIKDRCAYLLGAMNGSVKRYAGITDCKDYTEQITLIKNGDYATDVNYVSKIKDIIKRFDLAKYDSKQSQAKPQDQIPEQKNTILAQCEKFQKQLEADKKAGRTWTYHNPSKYLEEQWSRALAAGKRACNCALLARWALKEAGLIPQGTGIFYGKKGGTISWGAGAKEAVGKTCDIIKIGNRTVKQLINDGSLQPGDIVTYVDIQHTNIYAGGGMWYDAGHAYCSGSGEGAVYKSWYGSGKYDGLKVGYIIRVKNATKEQYIVQTGSFNIEANAKKQVVTLKKSGFDAIIKKNGNQYIVQAGVFESRINARILVDELAKRGFEAIIK